jgi:ABC-type Fe3+ transport system permease subunit
MLIIGVVLGFIGFFIMMSVAVPLFSKFKNINKRLQSRYGTKPNLWEKWRGDYPSNEDWKVLVTKISIALLFGIICIIVGIVFLYTLDTLPDGAREMGSIDWAVTGRL